MLEKLKYFIGTVGWLVFISDRIDFRTSLSFISRSDPKCVQYLL